MEEEARSLLRLELEAAEEASLFSSLELRLQEELASEFLRSLLSESNLLASESHAREEESSWLSINQRSMLLSE